MKIPGPLVRRCAAGLLCLTLPSVSGACSLPGFPAPRPSAGAAGLPREFLPFPVETPEPAASRTSPVLRVFVSPRSGDAQAAMAIGRARAALRDIHAILPASETITRPVFRLGVYADLEEYRRHARSQAAVLPGTLSRYDARSRTLHVPADAPIATWRHEWTHALLEDARPKTDFWLHEGLALLLEETASIEGRPRLPERIWRLRAKVRNHVAGEGGLDILLKGAAPGPLAGPTAAWFCAYLDRRGLLAPVLRSPAKAPLPFATAPTRADFLDWLRTPNASRGPQ